VLLRPVDVRGLRLVKRLLPAFEHRAQSVISLRQFAVRMAHSGAVAVLLILLSLFAGMLGYHELEGVSWIDSFLNAAMLLGGMGPVGDVPNQAGKIFAGLFALYSGLVFLAVTALVLLPIFHYALHRFHWAVDRVE